LNIYPGPGTYNIIDKWTDRPVSICQRRNFYFDENLKSSQAVSPQKYSPNIDVMVSKRYDKIGIGYGKRLWQSIKKDSTPGVGSYNLPSIFDRTRKMKMPIN
jgi:hypothetical protein